jgi:hypothetical protein
MLSTISGEKNACECIRTTTTTSILFLVFVATSNARGEFLLELL